MAWRQKIKDGICGDYSQMACNEWLSFPLMVSKARCEQHFGADSKLHRQDLPFVEIDQKSVPHSDQSFSCFPTLIVPADIRCFSSA